MWTPNVRCDTVVIRSLRIRLMFLGGNTIVAMPALCGSRIRFPRLLIDLIGGVEERVISSSLCSSGVADLVVFYSFSVMQVVFEGVFRWSGNCRFVSLSSDSFSDQ